MLLKSYPQSVLSFIKRIITAFGNEFIRTENVVPCEANNIDILQAFTHSDLSVELSTAKPLSLKKCESYCASEERCWGCKETCNGTFRWNAVSNFEGESTANNVVRQRSYQKPGMML